jgi:nucleotide-binding universal stress UspA family protein
VWDTVDEESRSEHAEKALKDKLAESKFEGIHMAITFGDAGQEIAEFAEKLEAGLIVLPSHGRTGLKRLLIGSVAERVVRLAHCPVLVLRS